MDKAYFKNGETFEDFLSTAGDGKPIVEQLLAETQLSAGLRAKADHLPGGLNVAVIAEPWSGDVRYNLPPLLRLAEVKNWEVRIFHRDQHPDLIQPYLKDGLYRSIPVFIFYDANFRELGHWIERPAIATKVIEEESLKLRRRLREENKAAWREATLQEILDLVQDHT